MTGQILIAGGGEAGLSIATTLREAGYDGGVCIVTDEGVAPYQRPPLSKEMLHGTDELPDVQLRAPEFFQNNSIELLVGRSIESVAMRDNGGTAVLDDGTEIDFDRLAVATGSTPVQLPVTGADLDGVVSLRTLDDAVRLRDLLDQAQRLVVVGGGFIGLEVAATARLRGLEVTVVQNTDRLMSRVVAEPVSDFIRTQHRAAGIDVVLNTSVTGFAGVDGRVTSTELSDGRSLPSDLVVVGVGARPVTALAQQIGLSCDGGIIVDAHAQTSHPAVVAAGDCTVQPHPNALDQLIPIESVNNATEQGKTAAHTLMGSPPHVRGVPWFWSNQGATKIQIAGISDGYDDVVVRAEDPDRLTALYYREGRLIAADSVNNPRDHMAVKRALAADESIDPTRAGDPSVPLKTLITE